MNGRDGTSNIQRPTSNVERIDPTLNAERRTLNVEVQAGLRVMHETSQIRTFTALPPLRPTYRASTPLQSSAFSVRRSAFARAPRAPLHSCLALRLFSRRTAACRPPPSPHHPFVSIRSHGGSSQSSGPPVCSCALGPGGAPP